MGTGRERAPDFTLPDLAGRPFRLGVALADGPVVLAFFRTTCPTSRTAFPYWRQLRLAYPQPGWSIVGISQDDREETADWVARWQVSFPILIDAPDLSVSRTYDPPVSPTLYVVEPDGTVSFVGEGFAKVDLNALAERVAAPIGAEPVTVAPANDETPAFRPG